MNIESTLRPTIKRPKSAKASKEYQDDEREIAQKLYEQEIMKIREKKIKTPELITPTAPSKVPPPAKAPPKVPPPARKPEYKAPAPAPSHPKPSKQPKKAVAMSVPKSTSRYPISKEELEIMLERIHEPINHIHNDSNIIYV